MSQRMAPTVILISIIQQFLRLSLCLMHPKIDPPALASLQRISWCDVEKLIEQQSNYVFLCTCWQWALKQNAPFFKLFFILSNWDGLFHKASEASVDDYVIIREGLAVKGETWWSCQNIKVTLTVTDTSFSKPTAGGRGGKNSSASKSLRISMCRSDHKCLLYQHW